VYLKEFLSDPRVVEFPRVLWWLILNGVILNIRPKRSAKAYQGVWTEKGSPLMVHSQNQLTALREKLKTQYGDGLVVELAMRYGNPSIERALDNLQAQGVTKLVVLPLYPQYSASTSASTFDAIAQDYRQRRLLPDFRFIAHYHDNEAYISAVANKVQKHWDNNGKPDKFVFSYHGIPRKYLEQGDPYHCECFKTSRLIAQKLGMQEDEYMTCFQSRFGREEWLTPYLDETLKSFPEKGIKSVQVVCPGFSAFSADCLETIEEIGEENHDYFLEAGGESFEYIEALNDDAEHIAMMANIIKENIQGWSINEDIETREREYKKYS